MIVDDCGLITPADNYTESAQTPMPNEDNGADNYVTQTPMPNEVRGADNYAVEP